MKYAHTHTHTMFTLSMLLPTTQPLHDPRNRTSESTEELARQDEELDLKVSQLHGAQAFRHYYSSHKPSSTLPSVSGVSCSLIYLWLYTLLCAKSIEVSGIMSFIILAVSALY